MPISIRTAESRDQTSIKAILSTIELFPPEYLDGMIAPYLSGESEDLWFCAEADGKVIGFGYCRPEELTEGTYNLLAIGVLASRQGRGTGKQMIGYLESQLKAAGHRILIIETSSSEEFASTRKFYLGLGYALEATIREFWGPGEDKVVFWKHL